MNVKITSIPLTYFILHFFFPMIFSVVVCTMEWNRWPLPPGKCQPFAMDLEHPGILKI